MFRESDRQHYDVAILGAGISGARIHHELSRRGHRVITIDRGDIAGATSQASGMMIWGGLLYMKDFDFPTVLKLSRARDQLLAGMPGRVQTAGLRYLPTRDGTRNRNLVHAGMWLYWLLGSCRRRRPRSEPLFAALEILRRERFQDSLTVEEGALVQSDCRFTLEWLMPFRDSESRVLNHCATETVRFDPARRHWRLELRDRLRGNGASVSAGVVINAAGVWTDRLNEQLGLDSSFRHELSKGVYINFRRPEPLREILVFDSGENNDVLTLVPWGPVAMLGPTETPVADPDSGFSPEPDDVRWLLQAADRNLNGAHRAGDIVSMRCGVRPLALRRGRSDPRHPSARTRAHGIHFDASRRALAVYGGKLTSAGLLAAQVHSRLSTLLGPDRPLEPKPGPVPSSTSFPGLPAPVPSAEWCRDHEFCHTLDDYLRRRTNIAQWIPRGGLGTHSENLGALRHLAAVFAGDDAAAGNLLASYQAGVERCHDELLSSL